MTGCATTFRAGAPEGAIDVIAHRGASAYAPENTLASFALAKELNADWFELDCTLTKDNQIVIIHDDDTERTTGKKGKVKSQTLAEIKQLDAGLWKDPKFAGEKLPTLGEALDLAIEKKIGVYIEIKNSDDDGQIILDVLKKAEGHDRLTPKMWSEMIKALKEANSRNYALTCAVIEEVKKRKMKNQIVIQSFSPTVCAVAMHKAPGLRTELLASIDDKNPDRFPMMLRWVQITNPKGFNTNGESLDKALLDKMHAEGRTVAIWTVDEEDAIRKFVEWGVDSIITNKPDVCVRVLKEMGKH